MSRTHTGTLDNFQSREGYPLDYGARDTKVRVTLQIFENVFKKDECFQGWKVQVLTTYFFWFNVLHDKVNAWAQQWARVDTAFFLAKRYNNNSFKLYECKLPTRTADLLFDEKQPSTGCDNKTCFLRNCERATKTTRIQRFRSVSSLSSRLKKL